VEIEAFTIENLVAKVEAGLLDPAPIYSNLKTFPWRQFAGRVDILSGGFPCQPFSAAGRRAGDEDPRHLFPYIMQGVRELGRPPIVFFENVEGIISSKLKGDEWADPEGTSVLLHVLRELERVGYEAEAGVFSAREIGAPHQRKRVFIMGVRSDLSDTGRDTVSAMLKATERGGVADPCDNSRNSQGTSLHSTGGAVEGGRASLQSERDAQDADSKYAGRCTAYPAPRGAEQHEWEPPKVIEPPLGGNAHGASDWLDYAELCHSVDNRTDELRMLGNGVVPETAERAFRELWGLVNATRISARGNT
jgi:DNA (cytosine-5)-methyltransferase 1